MNKKVLWLTETAVLLALLIALQAVTKPLGQFVTGSCVNAILAIAVLLVGYKSGLVIAVISPVMAFLLGIAPQLITVIPIMLGNSCYVAILYLFLGSSLKPLWKQPVAVLSAAAVKFGMLYVLVVKFICGWASGAFLGKKIGETVLLAPPMLEKLPAMFTWPQLVTALIGGVIALLIAPILKKALHK